MPSLRASGVPGSQPRRPCSQDRPEMTAGAEPLGSAPVFPGPPAGVEAADEVCVWVRGGHDQPLAGLEHRGVEGVEPLDLVASSARTSPSSAGSEAMPQRVSPLCTWTIRVGSGVPGDWVATEPAAVTKTPIAKATSRAATTTTTRPRRVSRTVERRGRTAARTAGPAAGLNRVSSVIVLIGTPGEGGLVGLGSAAGSTAAGSSCRGGHRQSPAGAGSIRRSIEHVFESRACVRTISSTCSNRCSTAGPGEGRHAVRTDV